MSPATKMLSVTTPLMSKARQPASQATPQKPVARPAPSSHSVLRIDPSEATTTSTSSVVPSESFARRTWPAASPSSASTETPVRRSTPASRCISAAISPMTPPSAPISGESARSATVTFRPSSRQTEAISEPMKPAPTISTRPGPASNAACRRAASSLVRNVKTPSSLASSGLNHGRARVPVAISIRPNGTVSPLARCTRLVGPVEPDGGDAEPPLRVDVAHPRKLGVVGGHPSLQHLLRQRGPVVRLARLVADDREGPVKTLVAQGFRRAQPGERRRRR